MKRTILVLVAIALSSTVFAGCIGDGDEIDSAIPTAVVKVSQQSEDTFLFDASASSGKGLGFEWNLGDGTTASEAKVEHTYSFGTGTYTAELLITDLNGVTDVWTEDIKVGSGVNAPPEASFVPSTRYLAVGEPFTVDATLTEDPEGDPITFFWDFNFLMDEEEYHQFREDKANGVTGDEGDSGADVSDGSNKSMSFPTLEELKGLTSGDKSPGHDHGGGGAPTVSLFNGRRTATEPVFTLEEGFPDPTRFYVKLTAVDVKGDSATILSEEVWPVLVEDSKKKLYYSDSTPGTFQFGSQATVTDATPDDENYADQRDWPFEIPDTIELMYVNVTWDKGAAADQLPNDIDVVVISPNGGERTAKAIDGKDISIEMTASDALGSGKWTVQLVARQGANIEYEASYWAKVDLNPFRDLEADYV